MQAESLTRPRLLAPVASPPGGPQRRASRDRGKPGEETAVEAAEIYEHLATPSAGGMRRSFLRRHIRVCSGCADFRDELRRQRGMLAVALPVAPSLGLKESALAAVGFGGGGGAGAEALIAALGAHGAAKVATIAITAGGALGVWP